MKYFLFAVLLCLLFFCFPMYALAANGAYTIPDNGFTAAINSEVYQNSSETSDSNQTSLDAVIPLILVLGIPLVIRIIKLKVNQFNKNNQPNDASTQATDVPTQPSTPPPPGGDPSPANTNAPPVSPHEYQSLPDDVCQKCVVIAHANGFADFESMVSSTPMLDHSLAFAATQDDLDAVARAFGYVTFDIMYETALQQSIEQ